MRICCVDLSIAARMIGLYCLVVGTMVMVEVSSEVGRLRCSIEIMTAAINGEQLFIREEDMSGGAAVTMWLLGLTLNEFGSRMRHLMHAGVEEPPHTHINAIDGDPTFLSASKTLSGMETLQHNLTQDVYAMESENQIYIGFLMYSIAYACSSGLLVFGSVSEAPWTCVPWLVAHLGALSAQTASLIVQVTAVVKNVPVHNYLAPGHPDGAHSDDQGANSSFAPGAITFSALNLILLVYAWIVVLVAMRSWKKPKHVVLSTRPKKGDETYVLSMSGSSTDYSISYF